MVLLTTQVYEKLNPIPLRDVQALLDWSDFRVYDLNDAGKKHGILLGTSGWNPSYYYFVKYLIASDTIFSQDCRA